ncbi:MAG: DNA mismatch repair endonuclease MutL [Christensenellales bacterium]|jgi:DNA mismatch repair protein MutL
MKINILDAFTANRIAAGEVVERPVSVVKELVENSVDAGATMISIEIEGGGIKKIRVSDNGCGIEPEDCALAFERHATSKINNPGDLDAIATLGFRGEALCSIAAVAQVELTSRIKGAEEGTRVRIHGGEILEHGPYGCPEGTSILVENLFFNTPARLEFLKTPAREGGMLPPTSPTRSWPTRKSPSAS